MSPKSIRQNAIEQLFAIATPAWRLHKKLNRTMDKWDPDLLRQIYGCCKHAWHFDEDFEEERPGVQVGLGKLSAAEQAWIINRVKDKTLEPPDEKPNTDDDGMVAIPAPVPVAGSKGRLSGFCFEGGGWKLVFPMALAKEVVNLGRPDKVALAHGYVQSVRMRDSEGHDFSGHTFIGKTLYEAQPRLLISAPRYRLSKDGEPEGFVEIGLGMLRPGHNYGELSRRAQKQVDEMLERSFRLLAAYLERLIELSGEAKSSPVQYSSTQPYLFIKRRLFPLSEIQHAFVVTFIELAIKHENVKLSDAVITREVEKNIERKRFKSYGGATGLETLGTRVKDILASPKPWTRLLFSGKGGQYRIPPQLFNPRPKRRELSVSAAEHKRLNK